MRIGELTARTGVTRRSLRYYEDQGLIGPARTANGYREYDAVDVQRIGLIRDMLETGLPTRVIREFLPDPDAPFPDYVVTPETVGLLERERDRMTDSVERLTHHRDTVEACLVRLRAECAADQERPAPAESCR